MEKKNKNYKAPFAGVIRLDTGSGFLQAVSGNLEDLIPEVGELDEDLY